MCVLPLIAADVTNNLLSSAAGSNSIMPSVHISNHNYQGIVSGLGEREHN